MPRAVEEFARACGASGPLRLRSEAPEGVRAPREFGGQPFAVLGSDPQADFVLDHPDVSRRHAYLQVVDGRVFAVDLESRFGLRIDGLSARSGWVRRSVEVGPCRIEVEQEKAGAAEPESSGISGPLDSRVSGQDGLPELVLEHRGSKPWRMRTAMALIGSASGCRVRIADESISRYHAVLLRTPSGAWVVDLMSRGGLSVNGAPVRVAGVGAGDELRVGRFRLQVRADAGADLPALPAPSVVQALQAVPWPSSPPPPLPVVSGEEDPRLDALVRRFGQMQQQMFDQFQQALMMMFQVFRTMHQDQVDLVRAEFDRVRSLGEELQELQARAAKSPAPPPSVDSPSRPLDRPASPPSPHPPNPKPVDADAHLRLHRRIAAIQEERQGRWQKILSLVSGSASLAFIQVLTRISVEFSIF